MSDNTKIEWTDATWTPIRARRFELQADGSGKERIGWHCEHASPGCVHCYAESINKRLGTGQDFKPVHLIHTTRAGDVSGDVTVFLDDKMLVQPLRWKKSRKIFVCSMTDLFGAFVTDEVIDKVFAIMAMAPHTFQVLTKRAVRMRAYLTTPYRRERIIMTAGEMVGAAMKRGDRVAAQLMLDAWNRRKSKQDFQLPLPNVWLGISAEDQQRFDERAAELACTPAARRFLSLEPLLGPIDMSMRTERMEMAPGIDWVIVGGESGPRARPMHPDWALALRDQCAAAGVPFHFKQWGEWKPMREMPYSEKKASATQHLTDDTYIRLDGTTHTTLRDDHEAYSVSDALVRKVGKRAAGRLLDGVEHNGIPEVLCAR